MMPGNFRPTLVRRLKSYRSTDQKLNAVYLAVQRGFQRAAFPAHNWEHIYRDALNAVVVGEAEGANMRIVLPAILMHDIGFLYGETGKTHGAVGARLLPRYLKKINVRYSKRLTEYIASCRTHKGSMHDEHLKTLEAKVVADADLLEKFGPFGVYQYIRTWTEFGKGIEETIARKDLLTTLRLETKTGSRLADRGRKFVIDFFKALDWAYAPYR